MRWELATDHYLKCVESEEWEHNETNTTTGKAARKRFPVPSYIEKGTIVCMEGKGQRSDIAFIGDPTPDMMPLDDEARELSASFETHWSYKPQEGDISSSQAIISDLAERMSAPVQVAGMEGLIAQMAEQSKAITALTKHRL